MKTINNKIEVNYKQGQTWWFVTNANIRKCEYLCPFPVHNPENLGKYDIIIWKDLDEPASIYRVDLVDLVEKNKHITSYEEACIELIKQTEEKLISLKKFMEKINNNLTENFVSFGNAKLLKEKGFDVLCRYGYNKVSNELVEMLNCNSENIITSAPTIQVAIDWFLKNYNVWIHVAPENNEEDIVTWRLTIQTTDTEVRFVRTFGQYNSPEEAKEAGISFVLLNLLN